MKTPNNRPRQIGFYILILTILLATVYTMLTPADKGGELEYSEIITLFRERKVESFALDTDGDFAPDFGEAIVDGAFAESSLRSAPYFGLDIDGITMVE